MSDHETTPGAGRIGRLAHRVAARHAAPSGVRGGLLGNAVAERRRPKLLDTLTRLAGPRSVGRKPADTDAAPPPPGMSDFAAAWMFGDAPVRGTPFAGGAAAGDRERPSFLAQKEPPPAPRRVARRPAPISGDGPVEQPRLVVEELAPFRLARAPAEPQPESATPPPAAGDAASGAGEPPEAAVLPNAAPTAEPVSSEAPQPAVEPAPVPLRIARVARPGQSPVPPQPRARIARVAQPEPVLRPVEIAPSVAQPAAAPAEQPAAAARASLVRRLLRRIAPEPPRIPPEEPPAVSDDRPSAPAPPAPSTAAPPTVELRAEPAAPAVADRETAAEPPDPEIPLPPAAPASPLYVARSAQPVAPPPTQSPTPVVPPGRSTRRHLAASPQATPPPPRSEPGAPASGREPAAAPPPAAAPAPVPAAPPSSPPPPPVRVRVARAPEASRLSRTVALPGREHHLAPAAARLAAATGATVEASGGMTTLAFAPAVAATPLTLARQLSESPPGDAPPSMSEVVPVQPAPAPSPAPAPGPRPTPPAAVDLPEIYEYVIDHLRRDLLVERERMGDLLGGLP